MSEPKKRNKFREDDDDNATLARIELIAAALKIPDHEIDDVISGGDDDMAMVHFALRYNQSLDWILAGDVRRLILKAAGRPPDMIRR